MSLSVRYFFVEEGGTIRPVSLRRISRIYVGETPIPEYAGKRIRTAEIVVEMCDRKATGYRHGSFVILQFDRMGRVDQEELHRYGRCALTAVSGRMRLAGNVISALPKISKKILESEFLWQPSQDLLEELVRLALKT